MTGFRGQAYIDFDAPPRARASDPPTSQAAGERAGRFDRGHYAAIREALRAGPASKTQIAMATGIGDVAIARRISELLAHGVVLVHSHDGRSATGNPERVYALAQEGIPA